MKYFFESITSLFKTLIGAAILGFFIDIVLAMISGVGLSLASLGNDIYGYESKILLNFTYALPILLIAAGVLVFFILKPIYFIMTLIFTYRRLCEHLSLFRVWAEWQAHSLSWSFSVA